MPKITKKSLLARITKLQAQHTALSKLGKTAAMNTVSRKIRATWDQIKRMEDAGLCDTRRWDTLEK
jgi:cell fate (sporulation/competence/biofilm development) regulator YmcA (YheA/YmcA/DUF963 family)